MLEPIRGGGGEFADSKDVFNMTVVSMHHSGKQDLISVLSETVEAACETFHNVFVDSEGTSYSLL
jgi:hypothetical protein